MCDQTLSGVPGAGPNNSGGVIGIIRPVSPGGVGGGGPGGVLGEGRGGGERLLSGRRSHHTLDDQEEEGSNPTCA